MTIEYFEMLEAKRKRLREEQESMMDVLDPVRTHPISPTLPLSGEGQKRTNKSFEERLEELTAFKVKHGHHVRVTMKQDKKSLHSFCKNMRCARRGTGRMSITEDRIKALDELGFDWGDKNKSFEERIEELKAFKAKHGHVRVSTVKQDKSLGKFCANMRCTLFAGKDQERLLLMNIESKHWTSWASNGATRKSNKVHGVLQWLMMLMSKYNLYFNVLCEFNADYEWTGRSLSSVSSLRVPVGLLAMQPSIRNHLLLQHGLIG